MSKTLVEMTAEIIQAQMASREMGTEELKEALNTTFNTLKALKEQEDSAMSGEGSGPVVPPEKSILRNKIICLECGQSFKMLSPKHLKSHGLTSREYRKKYGFSLRQPLCAKSLSEQRSKAGKARGIPDNLRKNIESRKKKASEGK